MISTDGSSSFKNSFRVVSISDTAKAGTVFTCSEFPGADQRFEFNHRSYLTLQGATRAWVLLVTGHSGDPVIHNDGDHLAAVIHCVEQGWDSGMEEGGITNHRHMFLGAARFNCPMRYGNPGPHTSAGMNGAEGWDEPQGVTADISVHRHFELVEDIE